MWLLRESLELLDAMDPAPLQSLSHTSWLVMSYVMTCSAEHLLLTSSSSAPHVNLPTAGLLLSQIRF